MAVKSLGVVPATQGLQAHLHGPQRGPGMLCYCHWMLQLQASLERSPSRLHVFQIKRPADSKSCSHIQAFHICKLTAIDLLNSSIPLSGCQLSRILVARSCSGFPVSLWPWARLSSSKLYTLCRGCWGGCNTAPAHVRQLCVSLAAIPAQRRILKEST